MRMDLSNPMGRMYAHFAKQRAPSTCDKPLHQGAAYDCAQKCLKNCTGMEHLILPLGEYPKGGWYAWVKAAPYVRVSDNDPEQETW